MDQSSPLQHLIQEIGSSFYFYDLDQFEAHIKKIKQHLHPEIEVFYATKANPLSEILRLLKSNEFGADVASLGELHQALSSGYVGSKLIATGPAKTKKYLTTFVEAEVKVIVVESITQLTDLNEVARKFGKTQDVLLRIQLDWEDEVKSMLGGSAITPFGLGVDDWKKIDLSLYKNINVLGLHCFQWGNILDLDRLKKIWSFSMEASLKLSQEMGFELKVLDLGGGLGLSYTDDREINFEDAQRLLIELREKFKLQKIWLELGRFSIGKFGSYLTPIVDIKSVRGKNLIITEGGINHMARPALIGEPFPCEAFSCHDSALKTYSVHGPLCTALDFLGEFQLPANLKIGDWLKFNRTGAYGMTESMPYFLCHKLPAEAFIYQGELRIIEKRYVVPWA